MKKTGTTSLKLTRGDKAHKKFMDRLNVFKDGMTHGLDSFTLIHKQTLDSSLEYAEKISKSQEAERAALYDIIKTCEDKIRRTEAFARLKELDHIKEEEIKNHNEFIQTERDKTNKNITGSIFCLAVAGGLISSKQVRQMTGRFLTKISNNLPRTIE